MPDDDEFADASDETPGEEEDDGADEVPEPVVVDQCASGDEGGSLFSRRSPVEAVREGGRSFVKRYGGRGLQATQPSTRTTSGPG